MLPSAPRLAAKATSTRWCFLTFHLSCETMTRRSSGATGLKDRARRLWTSASSTACGGALSVSQGCETRFRFFKFLRWSKCDWVSTWNVHIPTTYRWFTGHFHNNAVAQYKTIELVITSAAGCRIVEPDGWDYANVSSLSSGPRRRGSCGVGVDCTHCSPNKLS